MKALKVIGLSLTVGFFAPALSAFPLAFERVSNNGATDVAGNFSAEVTEDAGKAKFVFSNVNAVDEASITAIYFGKEVEFQDILSFSSIDQTFNTSTQSGVKFSSTASPANPGGGISWDAGFASDADSPSGYNKYGIEVGEIITFYFDFLGSYTFSDVKNGFENGDLAIAFHAQSITGENGYSDWFTSTTVKVPEPGTLALLGMGIIGLTMSRRRTQKQL